MNHKQFIIFIILLFLLVDINAQNIDIYVPNSKNEKHINQHSIRSQPIWIIDLIWVSPTIIYEIKEDGIIKIDSVFAYVKKIHSPYLQTQKLNFTKTLGTKIEFELEMEFQGGNKLWSDIFITKLNCIVDSKNKTMICAKQIDF